MPKLARWILRLDQLSMSYGCGADARKGGPKSRAGDNWQRARSCTHAWGDVTGEVELKELHNLEHDTQAFLASKTLWEWEHDEWLSQLKPIYF